MESTFTITGPIGQRYGGPWYVYHRRGCLPMRTGATPRNVRDAAKELAVDPTSMKRAVVAHMERETGEANFVTTHRYNDGAIVEAAADGN